MAERDNARYFNPSPLALLAAAFACGILLQNFLSTPPYASLTAAALCCGAALVIRGPVAAAIAVALAFMAVGAFSLDAERRGVSQNRIRSLYDSGQVESGSPVEFEGILTTFPEAAVEGEFLTIAADQIVSRGQVASTSGKVRVFIARTKAEFQLSNLKYGSRVRIACNLEREDEFQNPGVTPRREILHRQGMDATCAVKSPLLVEHISDERVFMPIAWIYEWRSNLIEIFRENLNARTSGVMIASLLGNKNFLDGDTAELFRDGGTFHILVISGLHITFIGGLLYFFVIRLTANRWLRFLIVNLVLWSYTIAVGADIPVVRAAVMFSIFSLGGIFFRQRNLLNSLAASALVVLAYRPSDLWNPSFQLTFVSVGAIVGIAFPLLTKLREIGGWMPGSTRPFPPNVSQPLKRFAETLYWNPAAWQIESGRQIWKAGITKQPLLPGLGGTAWQRWARYVFEAAAVSLIVQISMLPLLIVYFHTVSFSAIVLNIWVGAFIAAESFSAVLGASLLQISAVAAELFFRIAEVSNTLMLFLPRQIAGDGITRSRIPAYAEAGKVLYALFFIPLILLTARIRNWNAFGLVRRRALTGVTSLIAIIVMLSVMVTHPFSEPAADGRLRVDFLDVGQGDSALVTFPDGTTMLIDGGGRVKYRREQGETVEAFVPDDQGIGELVVSNVLWARGYSVIDYVIATHADADHIEGLTDIIANFSVGELLIEQSAFASVDFAEVRDRLARYKVPVEMVRAPDSMTIGGARVEFLSPRAQDTHLTTDNDRSLVIKITYGERSFLFTGDIEAAAESALAVGVVDVVKAAHHGSRTSSTRGFVDRVKAEYAVIPVGRRSQFGHPHEEVVARWRLAGARVLKTGESGMISFLTDGEDLRVSEFAKEER